MYLDIYRINTHITLKFSRFLVFCPANFEEFPKIFCVCLSRMTLEKRKRKKKGAKGEKPKKREKKRKRKGEKPKKREEKRKRKRKGNNVKRSNPELPMRSKSCCRRVRQTQSLLAALIRM